MNTVLEWDYTPRSPMCVYICMCVYISLSKISGLWKPPNNPAYTQTQSIWIFRVLKLTLYSTRRRWTMSWTANPGQHSWFAVACMVPLHTACMNSLYRCTCMQEIVLPMSVCNVSYGLWWKFCWRSGEGTPKLQWWVRCHEETLGQLTFVFMTYMYRLQFYSYSAISQICVIWEIAVLIMIYIMHQCWLVCV